MKTSKHFWIYLILGVAIVYFLMQSNSGPITVNSNAEAVNSITVSSTGKASVETDLGYVSVTIESTKSTAEESQDENAKKSDSVISAIKGRASEIKTTSYSVYANKDYKMSPARITGYTTRHTLRIEGDPEDMGDIVDAAVEAGADNIGSITFTLKDSTVEKLKQDALKEAIEKAKDRAKFMASESGVSLGDLISMSESSYYSTPYISTRAYGGDMMEMASSYDTGFETSDVDVTASVTASYAIG
jgi:uncharacterized protein YggE